MDKMLVKKKLGVLSLTVKRKWGNWEATPNLTRNSVRN